MAKLTLDQIAFLRSHGITPSQVFDASHCQSEIDRKLRMENQDLYFYFGGALCAKGGHSLRTKAGHCIQCDTSKIAYQLRSIASGYIYLAYSAATGLIKIGFTKHHPQDRSALLREQRYANAADWEVKRMAKMDHDAGRKEFLIHAALAAYQKTITYEKTAGEFIACREVFSCGLDTAIRAFDGVVIGG